MDTQILLNPEGVGVRADQTAGAACRAAKELENVGNYEAAREVLAPFWEGIGQRPRIDELTTVDQAELLLRVGTVSGWMGRSGQVSGAHQFAKDMISESIRSYENLGYTEKVAEAQTDLAICYWREGAMDEARVWFQTALTQAKEPTNQLRVLVNSTTAEISTNHLDRALELLNQASSLLNNIEDPMSLGRFYSQRAIVFRRMGGDENLDRALMDHTAARVHFEKANHRGFLAAAQNNIAVILLELRRYDQALENLDDARRVIVELGDVGTAAQFNETRARVYLGQERYADAEKLASTASGVLERCGEHSLLADTLQTLGIAQARQGRSQVALATLKRAAQVAETAGDPESSGRAFLTILEELGSILPANEIANWYAEADRRLGEDLSNETMSRLRACARVVSARGIASTSLMPIVPSSFEEEVRKCESSLIRQALEETNGSVTRAAKILGLTHQGLCYIINHRHKNLLTSRAPIRVRRKTVMKKG